MKALLIINPRAGQKKRKLPPLFRWTFKKLEKRLINIPKTKITAEEIIEEVKKICRKEKIKLDIESIKHQNHALQLAKDAKNNYDLVIVAGGDGTVNQVINGIAESKTALVIIPFGTINVLALELEIPFDVKGASELIAHGKKIKIDLGYAKTKEKARYFSSMVSVGFDASLIKQIDSKFKKRWGRLAYPLAGIKHLIKYKWKNIHVKHKSHSVGYFVIISNTKDYAGEYHIADKASITDGVLDLIIINRKNWWKITKFLLTLSSGKKNKFLRGEYNQIKEAHIYSRHQIMVQVDGELIGTLPVEVKIVPKALNVMVKKK